MNFKLSISEFLCNVKVNSFSAGASKETTLPRIRVSLLREGIPVTIVGDAVAKLEEELWYFHSERKQYAFRNQPNLNRVILDREETIAEERIEQELKPHVQNNAGKALEVYLWPENPSDVPDNKNLKLVILSPGLPCDSDKGKKLVGEFFEKAGVGFRVYKNTLFILLLDSNNYVSMSKSLRRLLALTEIQKDKSLLETLTKQSQEEIKKKSKEAEKEIPFRILTGYRYLAFLGKDGISWKDMGIPTIGSEQSISERVKQYLRDQEKLLTRITPKYLLDRTFGKEENEKPIREIYELHLKTPGVPLLEGDKVLFEAVTDGVKTGILGVKEGTAIYFKENVTPNLDSIVLRGEVAKKVKEEEQKWEKEAGEKIPPKEGPPVPERPKKDEKEKEGLIRSVTFRAKVPWDKLSEVTKGVIAPLKDEGLPPEITIEVKANSEEGFKRHTLSSKVKETLQQIGAKIEKWEEE